MNNDCLNPQALERAAAGAATPAESAHLAACPDCAAELALFRSFTEAEPSPGEAAAVRAIEAELRNKPVWRPAPEPKKASWLFARPMWGLGLAGLAAALTLGVWLRQSAGPVPPPEDVVRTGAVEAIEPAGDLAAPPDTLRWRPVPNAAAYRVELLDVAETVLFQAETAAPVFPVPAAARALMTPRRTLTWRITAAGAPAPATATFRVVPQ
jgi:hypothetical protein